MAEKESRKNAPDFYSGETAQKARWYSNVAEAYQLARPKYPTDVIRLCDSGSRPSAGGETSGDWVRTGNGNNRIHVAKFLDVYASTRTKTSYN